MNQHTQRRIWTALAAVATLNLLPGVGPTGRAFAALTNTQMVDLLKMVDDRQRNNGDWRAQAYLEQKEKDKVDTVYQTEYFRRSSDQKFMILFTAPKSSAGQGYLRIDQNLWFYQLAPLRLRRVAPGGGVRSHRRGGREAGRLHGAKAEADRQAGPGPRLPDRPHLGRQGEQEHPQAAGVRAVGTAPADLVLHEVEEDL